MNPITIQPTKQQRDYLQQLVTIGNFGETAAEVATFLVQQGITEYIKAGMIEVRVRP